jgi:hypothetical protein
LSNVHIDPRSSVMLHSLDWQLFTDVSGIPFVPTFKSQAVQEGPVKMLSIVCPETSVTTYLWCVTSQKSVDIIYAVTEAWNRNFAQLNR